MVFGGEEAEERLQEFEDATDTGVYLFEWYEDVEEGYPYAWHVRKPEKRYTYEVTMAIIRNGEAAHNAAHFVLVPPEYRVKFLGTQGTWERQGATPGVQPKTSQGWEG